jgi:tetratricopeptide (TPR) repeat protein
VVRSLAQEVYELLFQAHETLADPKSRTAYVLECKKGERVAAAEAANRHELEAELEFQKGEALLRTRNYENALACFGKALQVNPEEGEYHAHYGWCLHLCHPYNSDMIQEAIEHVRRGIQYSPDRATSYLYLGRLHKATGRSAAAEKMFTRALQILPECVEAVRELRLINLRREKKGLLGRLLGR